MLLRNHPRIQWPPHWPAEPHTTKPKSEEGVLVDVELTGPTEILLANEYRGKCHFAELQCPNPAFANKLFEAMAPLVGRPFKDVGALEIFESTRPGQP